MIASGIFFWVFFISRHRLHLQSSFYKITKILIVVDVLFFWFFNIENRAFLYGPLGNILKGFPPDSFFYRIIMFGFYFCNYLRSCIIIIESLNRFISILSINKRNSKTEYWLNQCVYPLLAISILISLSQSWFYFWSTVLIGRFSKDIDSYGLSPSLTFMKTNGALRSACAGFIVGISCLVLNGWSVAFLIYRKKEFKTQRVGINLFVISMIDFVLHCFHAATEITFYICLYIEEVRNIQLLENMFIVRMWVIDLDCLHRPWILLVMSEQIRNAVYRCVKKLPLTNSIIAMSGVNRGSIHPGGGHQSTPHNIRRHCEFDQKVMTVT
uniref:Serpentine receptor class gamma n=1 Tax=Panagrellus redivivus TaxID=6233 RepID=A0A7E4VV05_PANRE